MRTCSTFFQTASVFRKIWLYVSNTQSSRLVPRFFCLGYFPFFGARRRTSPEINPNGITWDDSLYWKAGRPLCLQEWAWTHRTNRRRVHRRSRPSALNRDLYTNPGDRITGVESTTRTNPDNWSIRITVSTALATHIPNTIERPRWLSPPNRALSWESRITRN